MKPLTFWFYAVASIPKVFPYNLETQKCQMADPYIAKMIQSDLTGQVRKKSKMRKLFQIPLLAVVLFFLHV